MPAFPDLMNFNGLTFDQAQIGNVVGNFDNPGAGPAYAQGNLQPSDISGIHSVGEITVINADYTAPFYFKGPGVYDLAQYHLATFGEIELETNGIPQTFYIHGFSENGLLLSTAADTYWNGNSLVDAPGGDPGGAFVLGFYGIDTVGGVDIGSTIFKPDPSAFTFQACFAEGTRLETASGPVAVEDLAVGDLVVTASGEQRPVKWIGQTLTGAKRHPRPWEVHPVRILPNAFGPGLPERDVRLSPGHSVFVDGVLVPVGALVNGATIVQEEVTKIRYFHIELDSHDVVLAEGLPCESYLDDGNRSTFGNAPEFASLHGRLDPRTWDDACAPLVAEGPQLVAIQQRLHAEAEALGWSKCEEADLVIEADGASVTPLHRAGNRYWFAVPAAERIVLRSNHGVLAHVMPGLGDGRQLGVAVGELRVDGMSIDLDDVAFGAGFYSAERQEQQGWRWTDGAAALDLAGGAALIEVAIVMVAPSWRRGVATLRVVHAA